MKNPELFDLPLPPGILREPLPNNDQLILWIPEKPGPKFQFWTRISTIPRAVVHRQSGITTTPATANRTRQYLPGFWGKFLGRFYPMASDSSWILPTGARAEQWGERQNDLLLVWVEDEDSLDEKKIQEQWPHCRRIQALGPKVFLLWGATEEEPGQDTQQLPSAFPPQSDAEKRLMAARQRRDRSAEVMALADLGVLALNQNHVPGAIGHFEEALALAQTLGNPSQEADILGNLGLGLLTAGQPERSQQLLEQELACTRVANDPFAEKLALEHLGTVRAARGDLAASLAFLNAALKLAGNLGDRHHQADLLWHHAIRHAEFGQRGAQRGQGTLS